MSEEPTITFEFRVSARVIAGEQNVTEEVLDDLETTLLKQIQERLGRNTIAAPKVVFEIMKTESV